MNLVAALDNAPTPAADDDGNGGGGGNGEFQPLTFFQARPH